MPSALGALLLLAWGVGGMAAGATESGNVAVVVYNSRLAESKLVAQHYARKRSVPTSQVIGLALPVTEVMTRAEFRRQLQEPLFNWLVNQRLFALSAPCAESASSNAPARVVQARVRYAVLCYGVPLKIQRDETAAEAGASRLPAELRRNEAAVDSELVCLPLLRQNLMLAGLTTNAFYGTTNASLLHPTNGVLLVGRLDGPNADIAHALVDKALDAERDGLWGRAYVDARGIKEGNLKIGDDIMLGAAQFCSAKGYDVVVDMAPATLPPEFPLSHVAIYAGWYSGGVCGPFLRPTVEFMPGAFVYHLHSFSAGAIRSASDNWAGPLLARGATCTLGSVYEPYLTGTSDVATLLRNWLVLGFSFGEAAWSAEFGFSWQTTVVGDPLYRPWHLTLETRLRDLERRRSPLVAWAYAMRADQRLSRGAPLGEVIEELQQLPLTRRSAVLAEKLGDLMRLRGSLITAVKSYEQALKLQPSPQQKVRLFLTLADQQAASGLDRSAIRTLEQFLAACPDYGNPLDIQERLHSLAVKSGDEELKQKCQAEIERLKGAAPHPSNPSRE